MEPQVPQVEPSNGMEAHRVSAEVYKPPENGPAPQPSAERESTNPEARTTPQPSPQPPQDQTLPQLPILPKPQPQTTTVDTPTTVAGPTPSVASDDDVIEKEWVDKAKKIVAQTKDNPYEQEKEVNKLQADYIKKRYGKDIKLSSD